MSDRKYRQRGYQDEPRERQPERKKPAPEPRAPGRQLQDAAGPKTPNLMGSHEVFKCARCGNKLGVPVGALFSTLGRTAARGLDAALAMIWLKEFFGQLMERVKINEVSTFNGERWEPKSWPTDCEGVGLVEAPRGSLAHWIKIHNGKIDNYQLVVPTTWNGSPRDAKQQRSAFEQSLIGTPVANIEQPVEILRTIHSFDPCLACAVHLYDPQGRHLHKVSFE